MIGRFFENMSKWFWAFWERKTFWTNLMVSVLPITLYYFGFMSNIRENIGSVVTYAVGILTVDGVFLTLLVTLKASPVMERLKKYFSNLHDYLYEELKKQIAYCVYFMVINLAIAIVGPVDNIIVNGVGIVLWSYFMVHITLGFIFNLKIVMNLATKEVDTKQRMK